MYYNIITSKHHRDPRRKQRPSYSSIMSTASVSAVSFASSFMLSSAAEMAATRVAAAPDDRLVDRLAPTDRALLSESAVALAAPDDLRLATDGRRAGLRFRSSSSDRFSSAGTRSQQQHSYVDNAKLTERHRASLSLITINVVQVESRNFFIDILVWQAQLAPHLAYLLSHVLDSHVSSLDPIEQHANVFVATTEECDLADAFVRVVRVQVACSLAANVTFARSTIFRVGTHSDGRQQDTQFFEACFQRVASLLLGGFVRMTPNFSPAVCLHGSDGGWIQTNYVATTLNDILIIALGRETSDVVGGNACRERTSARAPRHATRTLTTGKKWFDFARRANLRTRLDLTCAFLGRSSRCCRGFPFAFAIRGGA